MQLISEEQELEFDFDILDCTKIVPEELVPIKWVGEMVLNRNPTKCAWASLSPSPPPLPSLSRALSLLLSPRHQGIDLVLLLRSYFAETEQVAYCTSNIVPGMDYSNDPMLQLRNFSYFDTQISRLGGPNFSRLPINRSVCPFISTIRDGQHQFMIPAGAPAISRLSGPFQR